MSLGLRHLRRRKKVRKAGFPTKHTFLTEALDLLIYPVAIAAPLALVPQVYKIFATHDTGGLALPTWFILGVLNLVWLLYGVLHKERPIVLTNAALAVLNFVVVAGIVMYGK